MSAPTVRDLAADFGRRLARKVFELRERGDRRVEIHLGEEDLAALLAETYEQGVIDGVEGKRDAIKILMGRAS